MILNSQNILQIIPRYNYESFCAKIGGIGLHISIGTKFLVYLFTLTCEIIMVVYKYRKILRRELHYIKLRQVYGLSFTNLHNGNGIEISKNIYYQNGISIRQIVNSFSLYILLSYEYNQICIFLKNGKN
jgi:hypothetical protein